jgi:DNA-binding XRE family transcriptional regulator
MSKRRTQNQPRFPNQWRQIRQIRGLSRDAVAQAIGHDQPTHYDAIERGDVEPRVSLLVRLLDLYDCDVRQAYPRMVCTHIQH